MIILKFEDGVLVTHEEDLLFSKYTINSTDRGILYNIECSTSHRGPFLLFRDYISEEKFNKVLDLITARLCANCIENNNFYLDISNI